MSSDFWSKARGITPRPTGLIPGSGRAGDSRAIPRTPAQYNQVQPASPAYPNPLALAVPPPSPQDTQLQQFYEQGYNDNHVPQWIREQPSDRCPNCNDANYLITPQQGGSIGHCWDCGYSTNRRMSDSQVGNAMSPRSNAPASATRQAHGMKNFGLATPNV